VKKRDFNSVNLSQLLLGAELVGVTALALTAVVSLKRKTGIATTADHLVAVVLTGKNNKRGLKTTTNKTKNKVEGRLLLDVVISKSVTVLKLLTGEDKTLLIRRDTFLVLNLGLHVIDGISRLDLKSDSLASKSLDENLHGYKSSVSFTRGVTIHKEQTQRVYPLEKKKKRIKKNPKNVSFP